MVSLVSISGCFKILRFQQFSPTCFRPRGQLHLIWQAHAGVRREMILKKYLRSRPTWHRKTFAEYKAMADDEKQFVYRAMIRQYLPCPLQVFLPLYRAPAGGRYTYTTENLNRICSAHFRPASSGFAHFQMLSILFRGHSASCLQLTAPSQNKAFLPREKMYRNHIPESRRHKMPEYW